MRKMLSVSKRKDFHAGDQALQILVIIMAIFKHGGGEDGVYLIYIALMVGRKTIKDQE